MNALASSLPQPYQLLISCARTELSERQRVQLNALGELTDDWDEVLALARHHGLLCLLGYHLKDDSVLPATARHYLKLYLQQNALHSLSMAGELLRILDAFERAGLKALPYKGPILAQNAYEDMSLRAFKDLDLIVLPQDFPKAADALEALGYAPDGEMDTTFHKGYRHANGTPVELHHDLAERSYLPTALDLDTLWTRCVATPLLTREVDSFAPEDTLLLLCLHGAKHHWQGLIWLCDLAEYIKRHQLNWAAVLGTAKKARIYRIVLLGLSLVHKLLQTPLPQEVLAKIRRDKGLKGLSRNLLSLMLSPPHPSKRFWFYKAHLDMREHRRDQAVVLRRILRFALEPNARDRAVIPLPKAMEGGYYLIRPFRLLYEQLRPEVEATRGMPRQ